MDSGFRFEVLYEDDDVLKIRVSAWNGAFGGSVDVYVGLAALGEAAEKLRGFPHHPSDARELLLGAFGPEVAGGALKMRFYCADAAGHAWIEAKLESDTLPNSPVQCVNMSMPVEAVAIDSFLDELRRIDKRKAEIARLEGPRGDAYA